MTGQLRVHRATRIDALLPDLAAWLAPAPADPFTPDVLTVPTRGVERYLAHQLAQRLGTSGSSTFSGTDGQTDGVCAAVVFPSPTELFGSITAQVAGIDFATDPWRPDRLVWPVLDVIDAVLADPWAAPLHTHLHGPDGTRRTGRRLALAHRVARLFDRYGVERPQLIQDWRAGHDTDGAGRPVPVEWAWQPVLWRLVASRVGVPAPAERTSDVLRVLSEQPGLIDLPERLGLVGATRLPAHHLHLARALAEHRDVRLWLPDPSPVRWAAIAAGDPTPPAPRRRRSPVPRATADPLLRSLGRDSGELAWRLMAAGADGPAVRSAPRDTLLGALQGRISGVTGIDPPRPDGTVAIHSCHGRARQVEVLRDCVLSLLQADPTLEPRDIVVLCPDLPGYGSLVTAAFETVTVADGRTVDLRVRIADRTPAADNAVLTALARVLDLADGRITRSAVRDLAALPPVRTRFGFDETDLERLAALAEQTGVRWGLDWSDRQRFGVPLLQNTWSSGVDRQLLGATAGDGLIVSDVLAAAGVSGTDVTAIGHFAEFVDRLRVILPALREPRPLSGWGELLTSVIPGLFDATGPDSWQVPAALGTVTTWVDRSGSQDPELDLGDVRVWLAEQRRNRPTRTHFRTGGLTVCDLVPMRAVPYRVVCLLGLDDGVFPRPTVTDGDDITQRDPLIGERDRASEDRQQFLDALLAAQDAVVITYAGRDVRTNAEQPPSVPVGELLDTLADLTGHPVDDLITRHPLQPFDPRNFAAEAPFSHDPAAFAGALALMGPQSPTPFLAGPVPAGATSAELSVDDLVRFLGNPADFFLRQRLGLPSTRADTVTGEQIPVELGALARWEIGDRILQGMIRGVDPSTLRQREVARGILPTYGLGRAAYAPIEETAALIAAQAGRYAAEPARELQVSVPLPSGLTLTGVVGGLHGRCLLTASYSQLKAKTILAAWVRQLTAAVLGIDATAVIVARAGSTDSDDSAAQLWLSRSLDVDPVTELDRLALLARDNDRHPVPFLPETARTYTQLRATQGPVASLDRLAGSWKPGDPYTEAADAAVQLIWGDLRGFLADPPTTSSGETTRFGEVARSVWLPVLAHGEQSSAGEGAR